MLIIAWLLKASNVIKMDMVNPMPPKSPIPIIELQFKSLGSLQKPNFTAVNVIAKMPNGLPEINPKAIPKL